MMMAMGQTIQHEPFGGSVTKIGDSWLQFFKEEPMTSQLNHLSVFLENETKTNNCTVFPEPENVFTWTWACSFNDVKVVILGQDPYYRACNGLPLAHGLAFSVLPKTPIPRSLQNIFKELKYEYPEFKIPNHGYLMNWARQGVLLLNTCLTVRAGEKGSHLNKGWEKFTDAVLSHLIKQNDGLVFILWGRKAQEKIPFINEQRQAKAYKEAARGVRSVDMHRTLTGSDPAPQDFIMTGDHPAPQGANRGRFFSKTYKNGQLAATGGFEYFKKCNELLTMQGKSMIDWALPPVLT